MLARRTTFGVKKLLFSSKNKSPGSNFFALNDTHYNDQNRYYTNNFFFLFFNKKCIFRIFEGCGNAAFLTASFSAIAQKFPTNVASMFALIELFFGIGIFII